MTDIKNIFLKFFEYIFVFSIVIDAGTQYVHLINLSMAHTILFVMLVISGLGIFFCSNIKFKAINNAALIILFLILYFSVFLIFQKVGRLDALKYFLPLLIIILVLRTCYKTNDVRLLCIYRDMLTVIAGISLFFWFFGSILKVISPTGTVLSTWTGQNYVKSVPSFFGIYFQPQMTLFTGWSISNFARNSAIYVEAPIASLNFCLALGVNLFLEKKPSRIKTCILILAVLSTTSAMGFLILLLCVLGKILTSNNRIKFISFFKIFVLPFLIIIAILAGIVIFNQKMSVNSGFLRIDDFLAGFKAWLMHPIFGSGIGNQQLIFDNMSLSRLTTSQLGISNSVAIILAEGGAYIGFLYVFCFVRAIIVFFREKKYNYLLFCFIFLIVLCNNAIPFIYLTFLILVWMI